MALNLSAYAYKSSDATIRRLRCHAEMADYEKANADLFRRTRNRLFGRNGAFARSHQISVACERDGAIEPLTEIDQLLRDLIEISGMKDDELIHLWGKTD